MTTRDTPSGWAYGLFTYLWWGLMPLYFYRLDGIPPGEILGFRIVTSLVVLAIVLTIARRWGVFLQTWSRRRLMLALLVSTTLIAINWYYYTLAVSTGRLVEASLGYFVQPLLNAALGSLLFRERFRKLQLLSIAIALVGLIALVLPQGEVPIIALILAASFGLYSAIRKATPVDGSVGLSMETLFLIPAATGYLLWLDRHGALAARSVDPSTQAWLWACGVITALPLVCFGQAARRLRLSTLGFLQYISPSIQFFLAVKVAGEPLDQSKLMGFAIVWLALAVYSFDVIRAARASKAE